MSRYRKWSKHEEDVVLSKIEEHPENLSKCFIAAALEIGRTPTACGFKWHKDLSKRPENAKFVIMSGRKVIINRKNGKSAFTPKDPIARRLINKLSNTFDKFKKSLLEWAIKKLKESNNTPS